MVNILVLFFILFSQTAWSASHLSFGYSSWQELTRVAGTSDRDLINASTAFIGLQVETLYKKRWRLGILGNMHLGYVNLPSAPIGESAKLGLQALKFGPKATYRVSPLLAWGGFVDIVSNQITGQARGLDTQYGIKLEWSLGAKQRIYQDFFYSLGAGTPGFAIGYQHPLSFFGK